MAFLLLERSDGYVLYADPTKITAVWNGTDSLEELTHEVNLRIGGLTFVIQRFETENEAKKATALIAEKIERALIGNKEVNNEPKEE